MSRREIGNMLDFLNKDNHNQNYKELFDEALASLGKFSDIYTRLESLKTGPKGDPFKYEDFTPEQLEMLRGPRGYKGEQGEPGKPFTYSDFTQEQLNNLKGDKGDTGIQGPPGEKGDGLQIDGVVTTVDELPTGNTKSTYLVGTTLYFRNSDNTAWVKGPDIKGVDGKDGTVVTVANGYLVLDGVQTDTKLDYSPDFTAFNNHINDNVKHITNTERTTWNSKANATHTHAISDVTNLQSALDGKATATHTHVIADVTNLQSTLDGKASTTHNHDTVYSKLGHTHAISDITNLQSTLDGKLTKSTADTLYAPVGSSGGTTTVDDKNKVNANTKFGFVGDGITDNYQAFKAAAAYNKANPNVVIEFDGMFNGQQAIYRVNQFITIKNTDGVPVDGGVSNIDWEGKNVFLKTNGAKFVSMPANGFTRNASFLGDAGWYSKEEPVCLFNFVRNDQVIIDTLFVDGENYKMKFGTGITSPNIGANPRYSDGKQMMEGRGHGVMFSAPKSVKIGYLKSINAVVDGIAIGFYPDYTTNTITQTTHFDITNIETTGCGRLGISGLGLSSGSITNVLAEYNATNKNAEGLYVSYAPAGGIDIEPHHSPISMDNLSSTSYNVEDWNGNMVIENARIRYNATGQIACTSTLLTRNVVWERLTVRPAKNRTAGDHTLIQASLQNCVFKDVDIDGKLSDGTFSRLLLYGAGTVNESTGVITGQQANVWSQIQGGRLSNIEPWVNIDGSITRNDANSGEYGLHNVVFKDLTMENVKLTLRSIRRFIFNNVVITYPSDSTITKLYMWNSLIKDVVIINKKSTNITLDLGSGDYQSNFENLRITTGKFDWDVGTKKYKSATISSENLDVYDYTRAMEYLLANSGTGSTTTPADTTAPNAPTVNTVYANSTTITGTAEANSTVLFTGGFTGQTTANSSGAFTIVASGLVAGQTITVKVKDAAGNTSTGTTVTIQAAPVNDTTAPIIKVVYIAQDQIIVDATESGTLITTLPNATTSNSTVEYMSSDYTGFYQFPTSGAQSGTYKLQVRDSAGNLSNVVTLTNVVPGSTTMNGTQVSGNQTIDASSGGTTTPTSSNLLGAMSNVTAIDEGWGKRKNLNSKLSLNWNAGQTGIDGTNAWTIGTDKIAFTNRALDGTLTGTTNERYIYFKFEGLKASTVHTVSFDLSYSSTDDLTMFGAVQWGANSTLKRITMSFKTDANGAYGFKWDGGVTYGTKADGTAISGNPDAAFIYKGNLQINKTITLDKIMLNEGNTAQPYQASV